MEDEKFLSCFCLPNRVSQRTKEEDNLVPVSNDKFKISEGLDIPNDQSISFRFRNSAWYLRAKSDECLIEPRKYLKNCEKQCSFYPMVDLWFPGYVAFESVEKSAHYLRLKNGILQLDHYASDQRFKQEASFLLKKIEK